VPEQLGCLDQHFDALLAGDIARVKRDRLFAQPPFRADFRSAGWIGQKSRIRPVAHFEYAIRGNTFGDQLGAHLRADCGNPVAQREQPVFGPARQSCRWPGRSHQAGGKRGLDLEILHMDP